LFLLDFGNYLRLEDTKILKKENYYILVYPDSNTKLKNYVKVKA